MCLSWFAMKLLQNTFFDMCHVIPATLIICQHKQYDIISILICISFLTLCISLYLLYFIPRSIRQVSTTDLNNPALTWNRYSESLEKMVYNKNNGDATTPIKQIKFRSHYFTLLIIGQANGSKSECNVFYFTYRVNLV